MLWGPAQAATGMPQRHSCIRHYTHPLRCPIGQHTGNFRAHELASPLLDSLETNLPGDVVRWGYSVVLCSRCAAR